MFKKYFSVLWFWLLLAPVLLTHGTAVADPDSLLIVKKTADFALDGKGTAGNWSGTEWVQLTQQRIAGPKMATRAKVLYSETGMYFLMECEDRKLTATLTEDFANLYNEDVVEVFLWPDQSVPVYLEYELSPLNYELLIVVPNLNGKFLGWRPWHYEGANRVKHATSVRGGRPENRCRHQRLDRRVLYSVQRHEAPCTGLTHAGHPLARQLLPHRLRPGLFGLDLAKDPHQLSRLPAFWDVGV